MKLNEKQQKQLIKQFKEALKGINYPNNFKELDCLKISIYIYPRAKKVKDTIINTKNLTTINYFTSK